jgi:quinol monooxygenase YgiN
VIVVSRFDIPEDEGAAFLPEGQAALAAFAARPGFVRGRIGRAADDPTCWVLTTEWTGVGAYRRSLSSYDVKVDAAPLLGRGRNEPSAFEVLHAVDYAVGGAQPDVTAPSARAADAGTSRVGKSSGPADDSSR